MEVALQLVRRWQLQDTLVSRFSRYLILIALKGSLSNFKLGFVATATGRCKFIYDIS